MDICNVTTDKNELIRSLNHDDAYRVLMTLLREKPNLEGEIYKIATQILNDVDADEIMGDVYFELDMLDVEDLYDRSGKTRYGYVEPSEESWAMIEEAIAPFIDEMKKCQGIRRLPNMAKIYCAGIIKGLREFGKESNSEILEWAQDALEDFVENVFDEWKKGHPSDEDIAEISQISNNPDSADES